MRINKYLSQIGICSRREADKLVDSGRIKVNNEIAILGTKIKEGDKITIDNKLIKPKKKKTIFIAFNKPKGVVCTTNRLIEKNNIIDYINFPERIFPVGRLDKLSEGLIFLTNDGNLEIQKCGKVQCAHRKFALNAERVRAPKKSADK